LQCKEKQNVTACKSHKPTFYSQCWRESISKVESEIFYSFMKNGHHVYHSVASPLLLTTVCKCLGPEETGCWIFGRGMSSYSCLMGDSGWAQQPWVFSVIFCVSWCTKVGERSGQLADESSTLAPFPKQPCCCNRYAVKRSLAVCSQTKIIGSVPEPMQWFPWRPWQNHALFFMHSCLRAPRSLPSISIFGHVYSLNVLVILRTIDDGVIEVFAIFCWGTLSETAQQFVNAVFCRLLSRYLSFFSERL